MTRRFSRRGLFGSAALLATLPAYARVNGPDRELVVACGAFIAGCDQYDAIWNSPVEDEEGQRLSVPIDHEQDRLLDCMGRLRASTPDGIQARALALARFNGHGGYSYDYKDTTASRLLAYLLRDAAALGGAA